MAASSKPASVSVELITITSRTLPSLSIRALTQTVPSSRAFRHFRDHTNQFILGGDFYILRGFRVRHSNNFAYFRRFRGLAGVYLFYIFRVCGIRRRNKYYFAVIIACILNNDLNIVIIEGGCQRECRYERSACRHKTDQYILPVFSLKLHCSQRSFFTSCHPMLLFPFVYWIRLETGFIR